MRVVRGGGLTGSRTALGTGLAGVAQVVAGDLAHELAGVAGAGDRAAVAPQVLVLAAGGAARRQVRVDRYVRLGAVRVLVDARSGEQAPDPGRGPRPSVLRPGTQLVTWP